MKVKDASEIRRLDASRPAESKPTRSEAKTSSSDKVSTDSRTQIEAAITTAKASLGGNKGVRLEAIAAAVRDGTFKPDPQRIAQKILDEAELTAMLQTMLKRG
jgi:negative regulator of flagellin synthesis FlgM